MKKRNIKNKNLKHFLLSINHLSSLTREGDTFGRNILLLDSILYYSKLSKLDFLSFYDELEKRYKPFLSRIKI